MTGSAERGKRNNLWVACLLGAAVGLTAAVGFVSGLVWSRQRSIVAWPFDPIPLHAAATDNNENLVIATGPVGDEVDGVFFLDTLSGDLQCTVYSPTAGAFNSLFRRNVLADLKLEATKQPAYLMVTGTVRSIRRSARDVGNCIVYVAEANSGRFAAYAVPWRRNMDSAGRPQQGELVLLGVESVRTAVVRQ